MIISPYSVSFTYEYNQIQFNYSGYGFKADASMLMASYPVFNRALSSGKTLLDLSLVQTDVE
jgi:hypothetical protein